MSAINLAAFLFLIKFFLELTYFGMSKKLLKMQVKNKIKIEVKNRTKKYEIKLKNER